MRPFLSSFLPLKTAIGGLLLLSLVVGFLCVSFVHALSAHADMDMGVMHAQEAVGHAITPQDCCGAETSNHMEVWKSTLVGILYPSQDLLVLIVFVAAAGLLFGDFFATPGQNNAVFQLRYILYAREHPNVRTFNLFRRAYAQGLLNPKLYY